MTPCHQLFSRLVLVNALRVNLLHNNILALTGSQRPFHVLPQKSGNDYSSFCEIMFFEIVLFIKYFLLYLSYHSFTVRSDNKPSTWLQSRPSMRLTGSTSNQVIRWNNSLRRYISGLEHVPRKCNAVTDTLSFFLRRSTLIPTKQRTTMIHHPQTMPQSCTWLMHSFK